MKSWKCSFMIDWNQPTGPKSIRGRLVFKILLSILQISLVLCQHRNIDPRDESIEKYIPGTFVNFLFVLLRIIDYHSMPMNFSSLMRLNYFMCFKIKNIFWWAGRKICRKRRGVPYGRCKRVFGLRKMEELRGKGLLSVQVFTSWFWHPLQTFCVYLTWCMYKQLSDRMPSSFGFLANHRLERKLRKSVHDTFRAHVISNLNCDFYTV